MSRIGKQPIQLNQDIKVDISGQTISVKGPKGGLSLTLPKTIEVVQEKDRLLVRPLGETKRTKALWGLTRSLIANAVEGVTQGFQKELKLIGVGYRVQKKGSGLELEVGFSHKVNYEPSEGVELVVEKGIIKVSGIDKQKVGQAAAEIRAIRPPEPYKGKGVRYVDEEIKLKPGKSAKIGVGVGG